MKIAGRGGTGRRDVKGREETEEGRVDLGRFEAKDGEASRGPGSRMMLSGPWGGPGGGRDMPDRLDPKAAENALEKHGINAVVDVGDAWVLE